MPAYANNDDRYLDNVICRWRETARGEIANIGGWRDAKERVWWTGELHKDFLSDTQHIVRTISVRYPHLDPTPCMCVYEAVDACHSDHNAGRVPVQTELEATLTRCLFTLSAIGADIESRVITEADADSPDTAHGPDFRSVRLCGVTYSFTANQAPVVRLLYEAFQAGTPDVGDDTLLDAVDHECPPARLSTLFRDHPAWNTVIIPGATKGSHRLIEPTGKKT